ncbi:MAG: HEAT repeat domain-containing protein [Candidatus Omnitrophica bacterium]|nr:HEAT repeat domain-containing protein [Candidatus Omnitrophota bacterium]
METNPNEGRKLFFGLFIFPLLIAVGMATLLCGAVLLTSERETPERLVAAIKSGAPGKRWQKAFELSNELNRSTDDLRDQALRNELVYLLRDSGRYDAKTRSYMALALAHFKDEGAVRALREALTDPDHEVRLYALWSLGKLGAADAVPEIVSFLGSEDAALRAMGAYVLGAIGDKSAAPHLLPLLKEASADVRWNAALSLARLGDASGAPALLEMLDRRALQSRFGMPAKRVEETMIGATKGLALIKSEDSKKALQALAERDENLKVRQAAMNAIRVQETQGVLSDG